MKNKYLNTVLMVLIGLTFEAQIQAQSWKFIKEKDGVKLYSRQEIGNKLQTFKGVSEINVAAEKVFTVLENVNKRDWWDKNLEQIKLLKYEKNKKSQYYLIYKMPWPFTSRDMYVDVTTTINQANGERRFTALPLTGIYPEISNLVRIKNYKQQWLVKPLSPNLTYVELEFYVNPAEKLPNWLINKLLTDSPINAIIALKMQVEKEF